MAPVEDGASEAPSRDAAAGATSGLDDPAFGSSAPFTIGIEEELLLVRDGDHALDGSAGRFVRELGESQALTHTDLYAALLEFASPVRSNPSEAVDDLRRLRARAIAHGANLLGAGIHPAQPFGHVQHVDEERYRQIADDMRGLVARAPTCALHVHVGMPDAQTAIRVTNALRDHLPLLQALSANSPFWHGVDSGLASARTALFRSAPRSEIPRAFADWDDYVAAVEAVLTAGGLADYTFLWWDVRPHPRLGTVEVRSMDAQSSPRATLALAGLVQSLAAYEAQQPPRHWTPREALMESMFRAARDGVRAKLLRDGALRPIAQIAEEVVAQVRPHARELHAEAALDEVQWLVATEGGAQRQRRAFGAWGMDGLLEFLVRETGELRRHPEQAAPAEIGEHDSHSAALRVAMPSSAASSASTSSRVL
ncbi:MAG: YbdK family carboxylate-amine ligase [Solirubrobacteraceae bacterium]